MKLFLIFVIFALILVCQKVDAAESGGSPLETMMKMMMDTIGGFIGVIWNQVAQLLNPTAPRRMSDGDNSNKL